MRLLFFFFLFLQLVCSVVQRCENAQIWARGRDLLQAMKGQLVLVAFPTANDRSTLDKLTSLATTHGQWRVVALLEASSSTLDDVARLGQEYRRLIIDRDDLSTRQRLGIQKGDVALIDRCGRLSRSLPLIDTTEVAHAMRTANHHANCGWCQYGTEKINGADKVDAFIHTGTESKPPHRHSPQQHHIHNHGRSDYQTNQERNDQYRHNHHHQPHKEYTTTATHQLQQEHQQRQYPPHSQKVHHHHHPQQNQQHFHHSHQMPSQSHPTYEQRYQNSPQTSQYPPYQQRQTTEGYQQNPYEQLLYTNHQQKGQARTVVYAAPTTSYQRTSTAPSAPTTSRSYTMSDDDDYTDYLDVMMEKKVEQPSETRPSSFNDQEQWQPITQTNHKNLFSSSSISSPSPSSSSQSSSSSSSLPSSHLSPTSSSSKMTGFEDYSDYEDYGNMKTFNVQEEEITVRPPVLSQQRVRSVDIRDLDDIQDEDEVNLVEVPCKAITDDICYHQRKNGRKMSKCCKKGIYLADFCITGKCSNHTTQACCMQKYLQSRFQCCEDASMDGTTATDAFSRCCHAHFVAEDDCCPPESANEYWQSVHDICLPNTQIDLSSIKLEIRLTDGIRVVDLSEKDKWQHECKYGAKRAQYVYVPSN